MKIGFRDLSLVFVASAALLTLACGSKVVVTPTPAAALPAASVATPAPQAAVVATIPATPAPPAEVSAGVSPGPDYVW